MPDRERDDDPRTLEAHLVILNTACFYEDAALEVNCVRAYNGALAEFRRVSDRFILLAAASTTGIHGKSILHCS
jgi:hypothetical protein